MTPGERVVVQAAITYIQQAATQRGEPDPYFLTLEAAVDALLAERAGPGTKEFELTWGQVVVTDEIYNSKMDRWYEVTRTVRAGPKLIKLNIKGIPKPIERDAYAPVLVRRSTMGEAVDMFASVMWSAQSMPTPPAMVDVQLPEGTDES